MRKPSGENSKGYTQVPMALRGNFTGRYVFSSPVKAEKLFLLLHGFSQSGDYIFHKLQKSLPADAAILAPNAPFPVPEAAGEAFRVGFSWYFYESQTDEYYVDMELAVEYLRLLVEKLNPLSLPLHIIGYSQGGYLAPFVATKLKHVRRVIGINCQFLDEEMALTPSFAMDQIQGSKDEVVDPQNAQKSFETLQKRGMKGRFIEAAGSGHGLTTDILKELEKLAAESHT